mgnify:CR=1 FL=1
MNAEQNQAAEEFRAMAEQEDEIGEMIRTAKRLEGSVRNTGIHACGVIITPDDITFSSDGLIGSLLLPETFAAYSKVQENHPLQVGWNWVSFHLSTVDTLNLSQLLSSIDLSNGDQIKTLGKLDRKKHWETIYQTKDLKDVSWYQPKPTTSLDFLNQFNIPKNSKIIDIGGGDSFLVDHLLDLGYSELTVLDISASSLDRAKERLGSRATKVKWIVADAATFKPVEQYEFWHDRAAFHFLTNEEEITNYINTIQNNIRPNGLLVIGTFSEQGPKKCSGIEITQYNETDFKSRFEPEFQLVDSQIVSHQTPFDTSQDFIFARFQKRS